MTNQPPPIGGVRRYRVTARGVDFHVTEAGPADGRVVLALHGWPQHHWVYRDLLADPPPGLRIVAPDLPGYGWSGPAPHSWAKDDVARDVVALMDELGLGRVLLVGHDWGGYVGHLVALQIPDRIDAYLVLNMAHVWPSTGTVAKRSLPMLQYQPLMAAGGIALSRYTPFLEKVIFRLGAPKLDTQTVRVYTESFRDPGAARAARDTYRTFLLREVPARVRAPERRWSTVPTRVLFGRQDRVLHPDLLSPESAHCEDYTVEEIDAGHFIVDEKPGAVRAKLIALAEEFPAGSLPPN